MTDFNQKTHDTDVGSHGGQSRQMMEPRGSSLRVSANSWICK